MREAAYQHGLIKRVRREFPGCMILKNDPNYIQGIPDLLILHGPRWAALEVKRAKSASRRPNQTYYVDKLRKMSYASFVYPENEEEVLDELHKALGAGRQACGHVGEQVPLDQL